MGTEKYSQVSNDSLERNGNSSPVSIAIFKASTLNYKLLWHIDWVPESTPWYIINK